MRTGCPTNFLACWCVLIMLTGRLAAQKAAGQQAGELDSLKKQLCVSESDTTRLGLQYHISINEGITRITYWDSLLATTRLYGYWRYETQILDKIAAVYFDEDKMNKAIDTYQEELSILEQWGKKSEMLPVISRLIRAYYSLLDRKNSLLYIFKGLKLAEELKQEKAILDFYSEMALYYMSSGETNKALRIHFKCLRECTRIGYGYGIAGSLVDIGSDYYALNDKNKSAYYYLQALQYAHKLRDSPFALYHLYNSASAAYRFRGNQDSAMYYAQKGYQVAVQIKSKRAIAIMKLALAGIKEEIGEIADAERLALQSLAICQSINYTAELHLIYALLEKIYHKKGDYRKALEVYKSSIHLRDSLSNEQVRKQALEKEYAYNYEKKEQAYNMLTQQNQIQTLQLRQTRFFMFGLAVLLLAMLAIAYLLIKQNKYKTEHTKILMEQKLLLSQMNPHFIFNSLNSIQQFVMKGQNGFAEVYLSKFSRLIRELLEASTRDSISINEEVEMLRGYLEIESLRFSHSFDYTIEVDQQLDGGKVAISGLMIQPFVENAIWHGLLPKADDKRLHISFAPYSARRVMCLIDDNGVGRASVWQKGRSGTKTSLAIGLIEKRIAMMNKLSPIKAGLKIVDKKDQSGNSLGTTIVLLLPITNE